MGGKPRSKRPLLSAAAVSAAFIYWAIDAPSAMGTGGYLVWTPIVFALSWAVVWVLVALIPGLRE